MEPLKETETLGELRNAWPTLSRALREREEPEPDWLPLDEAPFGRIVELLATDHVSESGKFPRRVIFGFKDGNELKSKWRECTTSGTYVCSANLLAFRLPAAPKEEKP